MIHHVSIPARDPEHVARVLAELLGGYAGPFIGPMPGAWVVYQEDGVGTGIEVYTEDMLAAYVRVANGPAQRELLAATRAPPH